MTEQSSSRSRLAQWRGRVRIVGARARQALLFVAGVAAALAALLLYHVVTPAPHVLTAQDVQRSIARAMASATPLPAPSARVYQVIQPSLVLVQAQSSIAKGSVASDIGSGVIIDAQGDILTSLHVVAHAARIDVTFADGTQSPAQATVQQPQDDIAVLRAATPPARIVPATLGNPDALHVGDEAYVVGNPFGLSGSMSAGIISGFNRSFQPDGSRYTLHHLIQVDAAVNPGNSGGPLLNRDGDVVGIVTGLVNPTAADVFVGIGLAVPITVAGAAAGAPPD